MGQTLVLSEYLLLLIRGVSKSRLYIYVKARFTFDGSGGYMAGNHVY